MTDAQRTIERKLHAQWNGFFTWCYRRCGAAVATAAFHEDVTCKHCLRELRRRG
jgi:hypothetical protein